MKDFPEGHPRPYVRDGVADLPRDRQLAMLREAGVPLDQLFEDKLSRDKIRHRSYADLTELAEMLKPSTRTTPETIFVASLRVLGWGLPDIARSIAAAGRRHAAIVALDNETVIAAGAGPEVLDLLADVAQQQERARRAGLLSKGREAARQRRERKWQRAKGIAEPLWGKPSHEWPAHLIVDELAKHGIRYSIKTLHNRLGTREDAQERARKECS